MKSKYKYLIKNMGLLTLSSFATRLLSFFLVPLYTSVLSTEEYGTYDLVNTTISLFFPILTLDIQEAVLRFSLDKDSNPKKVLSVGVKYFWISTLIVTGLVLLNKHFQFIDIFSRYSLEFILVYIATSLSGIVTYYARGDDKVKELSISSVIASVVTISCNIYFLLILKIGLNGYFYSTILGPTVQTIYLLSVLKSWPSLFKHNNDKKLQKEMVRYSSPMVANAVSWWVNNASDRYVVTWLLGVSANGIYSVAYKIPSIISVLQSIFGQAWTLSAVKDFDKEDKSGFFINVYNLYNFMLVASCSVLIFLDKPLAKMLFAKDFFQAWQYSPFLMISTVFSGMSAFIGGLFSAMKNSKTFAQTSVITAVVNTIGNIILVLLIGTVGAAISTAIAFMLMWWIRLKYVRKDVDLRVSIKRDLFSYFLLYLQAVLLILDNRSGLFCWYQALFVIIILLLYKNECNKFLQKFKNR